MPVGVGVGVEVEVAVAPVSPFDERTSLQVTVAVRFQPAPAPHLARSRAARSSQGSRAASGALSGKSSSARSAVSSASPQRPSASSAPARVSRMAGSPGRERRRLLRERQRSAGVPAQEQVPGEVVRRHRARGRDVDGALERPEPLRLELSAPGGGREPEPRPHVLRVRAGGAARERQGVQTVEGGLHVECNDVVGVLGERLLHLRALGRASGGVAAGEAGEREARRMDLAWRHRARDRLGAGLDLDVPPLAASQERLARVAFERAVEVLGLADAGSPLGEHLPEDLGRLLGAREPPPHVVEPLPLPREEEVHEDRGGVVVAAVGGAAVPGEQLADRHVLAPGSRARGEPGSGPNTRAPGRVRRPPRRGRRAPRRTSAAGAGRRGGPPGA